jgi:uncharacterized protein with GYD domain
MYEITLKTNRAREDEDEKRVLEPLVNAVAGALFGLNVLPLIKEVVTIEKRVGINKKQCQSSKEEDTMSSYIMLVKWTEQGISNIKESPQRVDAFKKAVETAGGKVTGFYLTMGRYDIVVIVEFPSDEVAATVILRTASHGEVRSETLKAFPEDQYREIMAKVT